MVRRQVGAFKAELQTDPDEVLAILLHPATAGAGPATLPLSCAASEARKGRKLPKFNARSAAFIGSSFRRHEAGAISPPRSRDRPTRAPPLRIAAIVDHATRSRPRPSAPHRTGRAPARTTPASPARHRRTGATAPGESHRASRHRRAVGRRLEQLVSLAPAGDTQRQPPRPCPTGTVQFAQMRNRLLDHLAAATHRAHKTPVGVRLAILGARRVPKVLPRAIPLRRISRSHSTREPASLAHTTGSAPASLPAAKLQPSAPKPAPPTPARKQKIYSRRQTAEVGLGHQPVPLAIPHEDLRVGGIEFELLAQPVDRLLDRVGRRVGAVAPHIA
jgi:hypothetical protein